MAHLLATTAGRPALAYAGETPWHGLGTRLAEPATAAEAIVAAGLDYRVRLEPLVTSTGLEVTDRLGVVREDTRDVLGTVGRSYQPVQNHRAFAFLDELVGEGALRFHTAGALGRGERVWMLARLPGELRVRDSEDVTEPYLLLTNSHDGRSSLRVFYTPIRVVCANTLATAESRARGEGVTIAHRGDPTRRLEAARQTLGLAQRYFHRLATHADRLASYQPSRQELDTYFEALAPPPPDGRPGRSQATRARLTYLFEHGRGQQIPATRLSAWSALNAVTEWVDHHRATRGEGARERNSRRLESAWLGSGARLKERAWELALAMAG
jgi:phage/plasmid-like protein (TIGR03299 family)